MADSREVDGLREDAFKDRLTAIDKSIRDVSRNVQLVRAKQVLANLPAVVVQICIPASRIWHHMACRSWLVPKQS